MSRYPEPTKFKVKNPEKYKGDPHRVISRSSWENRFMSWCDRNENIIQWSSEDVVIQYLLPTDGKFHRYYVDNWIKVRQTDGTIKEFLIEIKPNSEILEPKKPKRITKSYIDRINTYIKNQSKWKAAEMYCESLRQQGHNIEFLKLNETDLGIK